MKIPNKQELKQMHPKIHQILTFKTLLIFTKNVLQNHIPF